MTSTIPKQIESAARERGEATFLLAPSRRPLTFAALERLTYRLVSRLRKAGVKRDSRVATVLPNGPESATTFLGVACGAACAPLNPGYSADQFGFYFADLEPAAVLLMSGLDTPAREVAREMGLQILEIEPADVAGTFEFATADADSVLDLQGEIARPQDAALLLHTSGTTARPKLVSLSHGNLTESALNIAATLSLTTSDRSLNIMPLFHVHGLIGVLLSSLVSRSQVVCTPGFDSSRFGEWLDEYKPSWYSGVPTMHQAILRDVRKPNDRSEGRLRFIRSSSAALPETTLLELEAKFGVPVVEAYGMTEASHQMASNPLPPGTRKPGSVGLASGPEVRVTPTDGWPVDVGTIGEVQVRGATIIAGYVGGANPDAFTDDWFQTGDLGYLDEDGYLFLTGRIKEMVNRGGENVAPAGVEAVLLQHPDIDEVVAFGIPHPTLGEDLVAGVVLAPGAVQDVGSIRSFALERLSEAEVPGQIVFLQEIPKGPTGKVQRTTMADRIDDSLQVSYVKPQSEVAEILGEIWRRVLDVDRIGANDNFFAIGGDSLSAARVAAQVRHVFQVDFDIVTLFLDPTLGQMADNIEAMLLERITNDRTDKTSD